MSPLCFPEYFFSNGDVAEYVLNSTLNHRNVCVKCVWLQDHVGRKALHVVHGVVDAP